MLLSWAIKFRETLLATNVICVLALCETVALLALIALSFEQGVYSTFALSLIATIFLYGQNIFFAVVFSKQVIPSDNAFKYWALSY